MEATRFARKVIVTPYAPVVWGMVVLLVVLFWPEAMASSPWLFGVLLLAGGASVVVAMRANLDREAEFGHRVQTTAKGYVELMARARVAQQAYEDRVAGLSVYEQAVHATGFDPAAESSERLVTNADRTLLGGWVPTVPRELEVESRED